MGKMCRCYVKEDSKISHIVFPYGIIRDDANSGFGVGPRRVGPTSRGGEMADTLALGARPQKGWGFKSPPRHQKTCLLLQAYK